MSAQSGAMTHTPPTSVRPDFLTAYDRAVHQLADVVAGLSRDDAWRPTPCADYDVEHLVGHVLTGIRRAARVAGGGDPFGEAPIELPGTDSPWGAQARVEAGAAVAAWAAADLDHEVTVPWGRVPGRAALAGYVQESVVHAWDLAVAALPHAVAGLDPALAELAIGVARQAIPDEARGEGAGFPFGPERPAPAGADAYTRLAALTGRPVSAARPATIRRDRRRGAG
jgi:uncharacterized protein (TIGR03086 family)